MSSRIDLTDPVIYKPVEGKLNLLGMKLEVLHPAEIEQLNGIVGLKVVDLTDNDLEWLPADLFAGSRETLHTMDFSENRFSQAPECITNLPQLQTVGLSDNVELSELSAAFRLKAFIRVDLRGTQVPVELCQQLNAIQVLASGISVIHNSHRGPLAARATVSKPARYYGQVRRRSEREGRIARRYMLGRDNNGVRRIGVRRGVRRDLRPVFERLAREAVIEHLAGMQLNAAQANLNARGGL